MEDLPSCTGFGWDDIDDDDDDELQAQTSIHTFYPLTPHLSPLYFLKQL
jgi:hypothetical protein